MVRLGNELNSINYIRYLDKLKYEKIERLKKLNYKVISRSYHFYQKINFDKKVRFESNFVALKLSDISILLENNGIKIYFSDYDIIKILIDLPLMVREKLFESFYEVVNDRGTEVKFFINDKHFSISGIKFFSGNIEIKESNGLNLHINDFIGLLNLIVEKERVSNESEKFKETLNKYILFTNLFSSKYEKELENILLRNNIEKKSKLSDYKTLINSKYFRRWYL